MVNFPKTFIGGVNSTIRHHTFQVVFKFSIFHPKNPPNRDHVLQVPHETRSLLEALLNPALVEEAGLVLLLTCLVIFIPAVLGYVGAVRENRLFLTLVGRGNTCSL